MKETNITPQQLWRTRAEQTNPTNSDASAKEGPSPVWRAQFKAQATQDMMDDVYGYVARRATWIEHQSGRRSPGLIREMIQDALGDTFAGVVTWDPTRCSLALHLKSVIRSRLSHEFERAEQFAHIDVEDAAEVELHEQLAKQAASGGALQDYVEEFERQLRELAADDAAVLALLDAYLAGVTERAQVCRTTGLTKAAYHNAHRRLKRLADNLPENLRIAALAAIA
jgi:hypothetical protein